MSPKYLADLVRAGKGKVTVRILSSLWEESWGQKGMLADVTEVSGPDGEDFYEFKFDYNNHLSTDLPLQSHDWFLDEKYEKTGTAFEAGEMNPDDVQETFYSRIQDDMPVEIASDQCLLGEFLQDSAETSSYIEWLENQLNIARNTIDRLQNERNAFLQKIHKS